MKPVTLAADKLDLYLQRDPRGISEGDFARLGRGKLGVVESIDAAARTVRVRPLPGDERTLDAVIERWFNFTGHEPDQLEVLPAPPSHEVYYGLGQMVAVEYDCVKDGKKMRFRHAFKKSARPALAVSPDGQELRILGGGFQVTERGIVDD